MRVLDYALRLVFFAVVPYLATIVSALFPMTGVLANIALTLVIFALAETVRERAGRSRWIERVVRRRLAFEAYYRDHPPRPFLYYVFYPILFPYWLVQREARRELLLYRGMTGGGVAVLVIAAIFDFQMNWAPDLGLEDFFRLEAIIFAVQTLCIFVFLLPVATTVVKLHAERRLTALYVLFGVAAISVGLAVVKLAQKRAHLVSWVTAERARLRTESAPLRAGAAQLQALRSVWTNTRELEESTDDRGWVEGDAIERAEIVLEGFYKPDEAYAFSLHASPPGNPEVVLLQCHMGWGRPPIWRAMRRSGQEITSALDLPPGMFGQKRRANRRPPTPKAAASSKASAAPSATGFKMIR